MTMLFNFFHTFHLPSPFAPRTTMNLWFCKNQLGTSGELLGKWETGRIYILSTFISYLSSLIFVQAFRYVKNLAPDFLLGYIGHASFSLNSNFCWDIQTFHVISIQAFRHVWIWFEAPSNDHHARGLIQVENQNNFIPFNRNCKTI